MLQEAVSHGWVPGSRAGLVLPLLPTPPFAPRVLLQPCSSWGPLVPSPSPQPTPQRKDCTNNSSFFSFFLLYTNIYRVLYTSLHRQCHSEHKALCGQGPDSCRGSPRAWLYLQRPRHPSPPARPGARAVGGCKNREAGSTSPLAQPASGLGTLSSHARFIPGRYLEGMGDSHHAPSRPRVLQPQLSPGSCCGLPSPCTEAPHLFCSIHPFLQAWNSYRSLVQERQLCPP